MDVFELIKQAMQQAEELNKRPQMQMNSEYMLVYSTDPMCTYLLYSTDMEFEKTIYFSESTNIKNGMDELVFVDIHGKPIAVRAKEYGSKWVAVLSSSPLGLLMKQEYERMMHAIHNQMPPDLKGKIEVK